MVGEIRPIFTAVVAHGCNTCVMTSFRYILQGSWCNVAILIMGSNESPKTSSSAHLFSPPRALRPRFHATSGFFLNRRLLSKRFS